MYSKETPNLKLPQWQPLDHPDFLTDFNESFKKLDELGQVIPDNEKQQEQIDNLTQQIVDLTEVIKELEDRIDNMSDVEVILQMKEDIDRLKAEVTALTEKNATQDTSIGEITAHLTIIDSDISAIKQRLDDYKETIDSNTAAISQNSQSITELENSLATLQTTVTNILTRLSAVEQLANQNTNNISEINTTMASLQNSVSGAVSAAEQAGQDATSAVNTANLAHSDAEAAVATANAAKTTADEMDARITEAQTTADLSLFLGTNFEIVADVYVLLEDNWPDNTENDNAPWTKLGTATLTRNGSIIGFSLPYSLEIPARKIVYIKFINAKYLENDEPISSLGFVYASQGHSILMFNPNNHTDLVLLRETSGQKSEFINHPFGIFNLNEITVHGIIYKSDTVLMPIDTNTAIPVDYASEFNSRLRREDLQK